MHPGQIDQKRNKEQENDAEEGMYSHPVMLR